jgi:hypothetical protein
VILETQDYTATSPIRIIGHVVDCPTCGTGSGGTSVSQNSGSAETNLPITGFMPQICADSSGSGTVQSCAVANTFVPQTGNCVVYSTTTANSGTGLTVNVNSLGAKSVAVAGSSGWTTTLTASIIPANKPVQICYDGTNWDAQQTGTVASGGGAAQPYVSSYVGVPSSGSVSSITSGAMTISAGDLVVALCATGSNPSSLAFSSSVTPNTWTNQGYQANTNSPSIDVYYSIITTGGSSTFTCTPSTTESDQYMVVVDIKNASTASLAQSNSGTSSTESSFTATTGAVSGQHLSFLCFGLGSESTSFVDGGWLDGVSGQVGGVAAANLVTNARGFCNVAFVPGSVGAGTAYQSFSSNTRTSWFLEFTY